MRYIQAEDLYRVDKRVARRLYNAGEDIWLCPCNMKPSHSWGMACLENKDFVGNKNHTFEEVVKWYEWYNCNTETGRYVAFYVKVNRR